MISLRDVVTGFGVRDPLAEVWRRDLRGGGSAEITGTLPLRYIGNGTPLTDYLISGNAVQDGTPTSDNPVDVNGVGVRTKNLLKNDAVSTEFRGLRYTVNADKSVTLYGKVGSHVSYLVLMGGGAGDNDINNYSTPIFRAGDSLIVSTGTSAVLLQARYTDGIYYGLPNNRAITLEKDVGLLYVQVLPRISINGTVYPMITLSTETDTGYEPYGYKLPLTVNGTEYPIYLGQVPTTRRIKKLVLTGKEPEWTVNTSVNQAFLLLPAVTVSRTVFSTHYKGLEQAATGNAWINSSLDKLIIMDTVHATDVTTFKQWLAAQYTAGTPVTVWYVLAEPETGIVNEPLMKIGDYADTISFAQAGVTIPTVNGANVLDMTSPVKPSEVYIKGNGIKPTNDPNFENGG